jgi:hypothetical protein
MLTLWVERKVGGIHTTGCHTVGAKGHSQQPPRTTTITTNDERPSSTGPQRPSISNPTFLSTLYDLHEKRIYESLTASSQHHYRRLPISNPSSRPTRQDKQDKTWCGLHSEPVSKRVDFHPGPIDDSNEMRCS